MTANTEMETAGNSRGEKFVWARRWGVDNYRRWPWWLQQSPDGGNGVFRGSAGGYTERFATWQRKPASKEARTQIVFRKLFLSGTGRPDESSFLF